MGVSSERRYSSHAVRAAVVVLLILAGACSGRSTKSDASSAGKSGAAGDDDGSDSGGSPMGGSGAGATGGAEPTGGSSGATSGGTNPIGGTAGSSSMTGGRSTAGSTATGGGGMSGAGVGGGGMSGTFGTAGERGCGLPAPGGCPRTPCRLDQTCRLASGRCIPSQCDCIYGEWVCTKDCGGGMCVDGSSCGTPDPSGCANDDDCAMGEACMPSTLAVCIPLRCACAPMGGTWQCEEDCGGGVCVRPTCPSGCEPQANGACGSERVTWVCNGQFTPREFLDAGCTDPGTQVPRFCCPPTFKPECL